MDFKHRPLDKHRTELTRLQFEITLFMMLIQFVRLEFAPTPQVPASGFLISAKFIYVFFVDRVANNFPAIVYAFDLDSVKFALEGPMNLAQRFKTLPASIHALKEVVHDALIAD